MILLQTRLAVLFPRILENLREGIRLPAQGHDILRHRGLLLFNLFNHGYVHKNSSVAAHSPRPVGIQNTTSLHQSSHRQPPSRQGTPKAYGGPSAPISPVLGYRQACGAMPSLRSAEDWTRASCMLDDHSTN